MDIPGDPLNSGGSAKSMSFNEKERLVRLFMDLRQPPFGLIGMLETRNLLSSLYPQFDAVRDPDIDSFIKQMAEDMDGNYTNPDQLQLT